MHRSFVKLLIKCDVSFPALESKYISRVRKFSVNQNLENCSRPRYLTNLKNCHINSFRLGLTSLYSSCDPSLENHRRYSQKVDVEVSCDSSSKHDDTGEQSNEVGVRSRPRDLDDEDEATDLFNSINYEEITGGDSDTLNQLKLIMLEVDVLRQDGFRVPKKLKTESWKELLTLKSRNQKRKLLEFLWVVEVRKLNEKRKKEIRKKEVGEKLDELAKEREKNDHIIYGFQGNTIFMRVYDTTINSFDNYRLIQAMLHGIDFVIDCGYDGNMTNVENKLCAKQLCFLFAENRLNRDPFNIHFCNVNRDSVCYKHLKKFIPTLDDPGFPMNMSENHYTTLFPKEKLVYLTPHCRTELTAFNPDDVYIVGALVDKHNNEPLSMAKAKSEGIRMAQLPLDRYLDWEMGTKSLTINQMMKILLEVRTSGNWNLALQHVPQRKLKTPGQPQEDVRRYKRNRGTVFQPPPNYSKSRKLW